MFKTGENWLFVPAREKQVCSGKRYAADVVIYDLEDALGPEEKDAGLSLLARVLACADPEAVAGSPGDSCAASQATSSPALPERIYIRVNASDPERMERELLALKDCRFEGYMIPKCEDLHVLDPCAELLSGRRIAALIETPEGVLNAREIAKDERVSALALGGEDLSAALKVSSCDEALSFARGMIVMAAAAAGKLSLDTVSFCYREEQAFLEEYEKSLRYGFGGKLLIHPRQAEAALSLHRSALDEETLAHLRTVLEEYERAGGGAVSVDGKVYERMHIEGIRRLVAI